LNQRPQHPRTLNLNRFSHFLKLGIHQCIPRNHIYNYLLLFIKLIGFNPDTVEVVSSNLTVPTSKIKGLQRQESVNSFLAREYKE
jgi:hypothetical protein